MKKNILTFLCSLIISIFILELFLRIYNPFPSRLRGNEIILPVNQKYTFLNEEIDGLDKKIIHTKNSLGFRGEEMPSNYGDYFSIITVGGSTTECFYLSDDKTWPYLLGQKLKKTYTNVWLNNAGLDGHSTFGHIILSEDYLVRLKPKVILFLVGSNDIGRDDLSSYDKYNLKKYSVSWKDFLKKNSDLVCFILNMQRALTIRRKRLDHGELDLAKLDTLVLSDEQINMLLKEHKTKYLPAYKERLLELIEICRTNEIEPIFITQPCIFGKGVDPLRGVNLEIVKISDNINGKLVWEELELYNSVTKAVAKDADVYVIDLANGLPKNSKYFYDPWHYTNEGAEETANILYREFLKYFDIKYKDFVKR